MLGVGEFVRYKSEVIRDNPAIALTNEHGIVVSVDHEDKTVLVAWPDGQQCHHSPKVLERTAGKIADAARSVGQTRRPLPDKGNRGLRPPMATGPTPRNATPAARWAMTEPKQIKGFVMDPTPKRPDGGYMAFKTPLVSVEVRADHWGADTAPIKLSRSAQSVTVTFPNGEKASHTFTGARAWAESRFGEDFASSVCNAIEI